MGVTVRARGRRGSALAGSRYAPQDRKVRSRVGTLLFRYGGCVGYYENEYLYNETSVCVWFSTTQLARYEDALADVMRDSGQFAGVTVER